jgi:rare lipoprotein A
MLAACSSGPAPQTGNDGMASTATGARFKVGKPYKIDGNWYYPKHEPSYDKIGVASWYGDDFQGLATANGEVFDKGLMTAAHTTLPLPSLVRVTNLANGKSLVMRVNDRGPFVNDRLIDLSQAAARELGYEQQGLAKVRVQFLQIADDATGVPTEIRSPAVPPAAVPNRILVADASESPTVPRAALTPVSPARALPATPRPAPSPLAAANPAVPGDCAEGWVVQVGAFADSSTVRAVATEVSHLHSVRIEPAFAGSTPVARLRLGPLDNRREAASLLGQVHKLGYPTAFAACVAGHAQAVRISGTPGASTMPAGRT